MATKGLFPVLAALALLAGCGGDKSDAKQAALAPAKPKKGVLKAAAENAADAEADIARPPVKPSIAKAGAAAPAPASPTVADAPTTAAPATSAATAAPDSGAGNEQDRSLGRESFAYTGGSRDPFVSLLQSAKVGPELPDLLLVAIYYDTRNPVASVVVMREKVGGKKYSLKPGDRLGRMKVSEIRPKDVVFTIDDFGTERQETVSLRKEEKQ